MDKVAIYARVSTIDNQEYERQISDLTSVILQHRYKDTQIVTYAEKLSGYKKERPELNKLLSESDQYKCIYVTEISRLGRNPSHTREIIDRLTEKGIPVYIQSIGQATIDKDGKRNAIMSIVLQVLMEFSHIEAEQTKSRMKSGKIQAVKDKRVHGANLAYGYRNDNKMLVIDEEESSVVRMIFNLCKDGLGTDLIAQKLNQMGIPTRRAVTHKDKGYKVKGTNLKMDATKLNWGNTVIRQILKNPIYYGKRNYNGESYDCPAIITEELFMQCKQATSNRTSKRDEVQTYLLKNLMYCGVCGKKYMGKYIDSKKASKVYFCTANIRTKNCCNSAPYLLYTESVFYNMFLSTDITSYIDNPDEIKTNLESDLQKINIEIETIAKNKTEKEAEQNRLIQLFTSGSFQNQIDTLNQMNEKINEELESINSKLLLLKDKQLELKLALSNYNEEINSQELIKNAKDNRQELRKIFQQLISKIIVNKINDNYTMLTFYAKLKGVVLPNPLKIFLDLKSATRNKKTNHRDFRYIPTLSITNEPIFENNILKTDLSELSNELNQVIEQASIQTQTIMPYQFEIIPKENWLYIAESDL